MELRNVMEEMVSSYVDVVMEKDKQFCGCPRCRQDVAAIALNNLQPKYVVTDKGYAYAHMGELQAQFRADTVIAVTKAVKIVKNNPLH